MDPHYKPFVGISFNSIAPEDYRGLETVVVYDLDMPRLETRIELTIYKDIGFDLHVASLTYKRGDGNLERFVGETLVNHEPLVRYCLEKFRRYNIAYHAPVMDLLEKSFDLTPENRELLATVIQMS